jgi:hypothetical protein
VAKSHLAELIAAAGLSPRAWYGDWDRRAYSPNDREIIAVLKAI